MAYARYAFIYSRAFKFASASWCLPLVSRVAWQVLVIVSINQQGVTPLLNPSGRYTLLYVSCLSSSRSTFGLCPCCRMSSLCQSVLCRSWWPLLPFPCCPSPAGPEWNPAKYIAPDFPYPHLFLKRCVQVSGISDYNITLMKRKAIPHQSLISVLKFVIMSPGGLQLHR